MFTLTGFICHAGSGSKAGIDNALGAESLQANVHSNTHSYHHKKANKNNQPVMLLRKYQHPYLVPPLGADYTAVKLHTSIKEPGVL